MKILLCAATEMEIAPTLANLPANHDIEIVVTGIGIACTAYTITKAVALNRPALLVQAGVAGSLDEGLSLASVVAVSSDCIGDIGVRQDGKFQSLFDLQLPGVNVSPWVSGSLPNHTPLVQNTGLHAVKGVTVNEITTSAERIDYYRHKLGASLESMEGAAMHYVALQEKLPFLQLRSISNFIGERDKTKWQLRPAIINLNRELQRILKVIHT